MQVADITIISRGIPPELIEKPNKSTINLLSILLNSRYFNDFVTSFIDKYAIEQEDIKPNLSKVINDLNTCYKYPEIATVVDVLGLSSDFIPDFYLLAKYKAFRDIGNYFTINYRSTVWHLKIDSEEAIRDKRELSGIIFKNKISKKEMLNWVNENWEWIEPNMAELPVNPFVVTDFKDIELASEIYDLNKQGMKPKEILDTLSDKYQDNQQIYDNLSLELVKNKLKRFRKLLKEREPWFQKTEIRYE